MAEQRRPCVEPKPAESGNRDVRDVDTSVQGTAGLSLEDGKAAHDFGREITERPGIDHVCESLFRRAASIGPPGLRDHWLRRFGGAQCSCNGDDEIFFQPSRTALDLERTGK